MAFLDFAALKDSVRIEDTLHKLQLKMYESNNQFRGACPVCKGGSPRSLVITPAKQAFYCFAGRIGGDVIALVAHIQNVSMKEAAEFLAEKKDLSSYSVSTVPKERIKEDARNLQPLTYLDPSHKKLASLGLSDETCTFFGGGYAPKGILRGKFAFPIHCPDENLIAYGGIDLNDPTTDIKFPKDFDPQNYIFNLHHQNDDEILLCRSTLEVMQTHQAGIENVISFLTEKISSYQLRMLSEQLGERHLVLP